MITKDGINVNRVCPSGAWSLYAMDPTDHYLVSRQYTGYSQHEAIAMFRAELAGMAPVYPE